MDFIEEAIKMCRSSARASEHDVPLLVKILGKLKEESVIVQLGAGSIFTVTILGAKPKATLYSIDNDMHAFYHEDAALTNCGATDFNRIMVVNDCVKAAVDYKGPKIDLLIIDSDHTEDCVLSSLKGWKFHMRPTHYIMMHDYEGQGKGPRFVFPDVKKACDKFFKDEPTWEEGWSAVWQIKPEAKKRKKAKTK